MLQKPGGHILMSVRDTFVEEVKKKWALRDAVTIDIRNKEPGEAAELIRKDILPIHIRP